MDNSTNTSEMSRHEKQLEYRRKWYAKNRERITQQWRERYRNDPDYREKFKAGNKRRYINALRREGYTVIPPEGVEG